MIFISIFKSVLILVFLVVSLSSCFRCTPSASNRKENRSPNVLIIYTDDQGSIDLNCYGATDLVTPNMDKLVKNGIKFTQFYAAPVCAPSRASLLTGKTPQRAGVPGNVNSMQIEDGMPNSQYTMAEMFKDAGYATAHIGKWHLGAAEDKQPNAQGFDYSFGHFVGCIDNYSHYFFWNGPNRHDLHRNGEEVFYPGEYFPDLMLKEATEFIDDNKDTPFFMYYAMNTPHYPYQGKPEWLEYYQNKGVAYPRDLYAAFLSTMDDNIGSLIQKLKKQGIYENTIIIFQSDNGHSNEMRAHAGGGSSGIFRGAKASLFEGGIRVPAAISWPAKLPAGEVRNQLAVNADWMPTLAELCGIEIDTKDLDGKSLVSIFKDGEKTTLHEKFCWRFWQQKVARKGEWKLLMYPVMHSPTYENLVAPKDSIFLANLREDPGETTNLACEYPEKVEELKLQFEVWAKYNRQ
jgi:arylsulfatase A